LRAVSALYPIIDVDLCRHRGIDPGALAGACLRGGATLLQVRQKDGATGAFLSLVRSIVRQGRERDATIVVNDRSDIAAMAGAHGVHVGQEDLPVPAVRAVCGRETCIGVSTHTQTQVDAALQADVDYLAVGPIFSTMTKDTGYTARGLDLVRYAAGRGKPVVAIGGITVDGARAVRDAGAAAVAVISDLLAGDDPETRVREYLRALSI
jgi:thiamine-phosphate pyrophosphorylase